MAVESNRMLGGIGASLMVVSAVSSLLVLPRLFDPYSTGASTVSPISTILGLAGLAGIILFMVAMRGFAGDYKDSGIFDNALYGLLSSIIVAAVAGGLMVAVILMNLGNVISAFTSVPLQTELFQSILGYVVPVMPVFSLAGLVQALFMMRSFNIIDAKSEAHSFRTAGLALVAGGVLTLILASIGALLFFAASISATAALVITFAGTTVGYLAWIFAAKAFFSIKVPTSQPLPTSPAGKARYCSQCGAENLPDAVFCAKCGKSLQP
jgi:uncharacterized membrane protein